MQLTTYLGPFFELTFEKAKIQGTKCKYPPECEMKQEDIYCSKCGVKNSEKNYNYSILLPHVPDWLNGDVFSEMTKVTAIDVVQRFFIPNHDRKQPREFLLKDKQVIYIDSINIDKEINWLKNAFARELKKIEDIFKDFYKETYSNYIKVSWGLLSEYW